MHAVSQQYGYNMSDAPEYSILIDEFMSAEDIKEKTLANFFLFL